MKTRIRRSITAAIGSLLFYQTAPASHIYSNNFDSAALGSVVAPFVHSGGTGSCPAIVIDPNNAGNQYLKRASKTDTDNCASGKFDGSQINDQKRASARTFKFDQILNTATFPATSQLRIRARDTGFTTVTTDTVHYDLNDEILTAHTQYRVEYVVNNSIKNATAPYIGKTIASGNLCQRISSGKRKQLY